MRFYTGQHQYYCLPDVRQAGSTCPNGIPSGHSKNMYVCFLDQAGNILLHKNFPAKPQVLLHVIEPYLPDIAITVECMFTWYPSEPGRLDRRSLPQPEHFVCIGSCTVHESRSRIKD